MVVALGSCSKSADVKCGAGTVLKDGQCLATQGSAQGSTQPQAAHEQGSGSAQPAAVAANEPAKPAGPQWSFRTDKDKMRDKSVYFAAVHSSDSEMGVTIRQGQPGSAFGLDVILELAHGQFQCSSEGCSYSVKFDSGPIERWQMTNAEGLNGHVLFVRNAEGFVEKLRKAHTLIIEINRFQAGIAQISFDVPPLDAWEGLSLVTASGAKGSAKPSRLYCATEEFDGLDPLLICATTSARCEAARDQLASANTGTVLECETMSPGPCAPDGEGMCATKARARPEEAKPKKGAMDGFVDTPATPPKPEQKAGYCFDSGGNTSCGRTLDDCKAYMQAKNITDASCKKVGKTPCAFDSGDPYCDTNG